MAKPYRGKYRKYVEERVEHLQDKHINRRSFMYSAAAVGAALAAGRLMPAIDKSALNPFFKPGLAHAAGTPPETYLDGKNQAYFEQFEQKDPLKTIGLGVSVQERFFVEFEKRTGKKMTGTVTGLSEMIQKMLTGGAKEFDMIETNAYRTQALVDGEAIQPIPVEMITNWKYANPMFWDEHHIGADRYSDWPRSEVYWDETKATFKAVPQFFNMDTFGYNPSKLIPAPWTFHVLYQGEWGGADLRGRTAIQNDEIISLGRCAQYLKMNHLMDECDAGQLTPPQVDTVVEFLKERKADGQFRVFWDDYGQAVNLLASEEVWVLDAWNPVVEDVKKRGIPCLYTDPWEGNVMWFHSIGMSKFTKQPEIAMAYMDFCLEGWWAAQVALQGYYSPADTALRYLSQKDYDYWYLGNGRDTGPQRRRQANIGWWMKWPDNLTYYIEKWQEFLAA